LSADLDLAYDGVVAGEASSSEADSVTIDCLLEAARDSKCADYVCYLCCQRLALGSALTAELPSLKSVVQNGHNYHAVCVNLWLMS